MLEYHEKKTTIRYGTVPGEGKLGNKGEYVHIYDLTYVPYVRTNVSKIIDISTIQDRYKDNISRER